MNEQLKQSRQEKHEYKDGGVHSHENSGNNQESLRENTEKSQEELEVIRQNAQHEAKSKDEVLQDTYLENPNQEQDNPALINRELKNIAYQRLLRRTRRHLSPYSRAMSSIIHQPGVDAVSEAVGKTIGRPSGIIGGGLLALIGTSVYYYLSRRYGYSYNSFVFLFLMAIGFVLGWCAEVLYKAARSSAKK